MVDLKCLECNHIFEDISYSDILDIFECPICKNVFEINYEKEFTEDMTDSFDIFYLTHKFKR